MHTLRKLLRPKVVLSGLFAAVILAIGMGAVSQETAFATTCPGRDGDDNAIIRCGYGNLGSGTDGFAAKYTVQNNATHDLAAVYGKFGFTSVGDFSKNAQHVTVYKNGEVKLDSGVIVATGTNSLGRQSFGNPNRHPLTINGNTYYFSTTQNSFASGTNSITGFALFDKDDHSMTMGTMTSCGNPFWGNSPGYKCDMLQQTKTNDTTYTYVAKPFVKNGATVTKIVYDYGDGSSKTVTSDFGQTVTHSYAPGDYTARATVFFNENGSTVSDTRADCTKPVHVAQPPKPVFACTELIAKQAVGSRTKFTFTASAIVKNGAVLQKGTFKFDDGTTASMNAVGNTVTITHDYTVTGDHTTKADLTFNDGVDNGNVKCIAQTTTTPPTCKDTPTKPECIPCKYNNNLTSASPNCVPPCKYNDKISSNSPDCKPPKTCADTPNAPECQPPVKDCKTNPEMDICKPLPSTGPEEVASTVLGLTTVTGAGAYYHASRRNLFARFFKR